MSLGCGVLGEVLVRSAFHVTHQPRRTPHAFETSHNNSQISQVYSVARAIVEIRLRRGTHQRLKQPHGGRTQPFATAVQQCCHRGRQITRINGYHSGAIKQPNPTPRAEHRFVIPTAMQQTILNAAHEGHPGIVCAKRQLRLTYWWPGMDSRVENHVKHCIACQDSAKSHKPAKVPLTRIEPPTQPWTKIALDISGPYQLHDLVRVPKGSTPFSEQRRITAILGHYTY